VFTAATGGRPMRTSDEQREHADGEDLSERREGENNHDSTLVAAKHDQCQSAATIARQRGTCRCATVGMAAIDGPPTTSPKTSRRRSKASKQVRRGCYDRQRSFKKQPTFEQFSRANIFTLHCYPTSPPGAVRHRRTVEILNIDSLVTRDPISLPPVTAVVALAWMGRL